MRSIKFTEVEIVKTLLLVKFIVENIQKMNRNLRQQSFALLMFIISSSWLIRSIISYNSFTTFELAICYLTNGSQMLGALTFIVTGGLDNNNNKTNKYKFYFTAFCRLCFFIAAFWVAYSLIYYNFPTVKIYQYAMFGNLAQLVTSYFMIYSFDKKKG